MNRYVITKEDIYCLFGYFQAAFDGEENKSVLKRLFNTQCGTMRSNLYVPSEAVTMTPEEEEKLKQEISDVFERMRPMFPFIAFSIMVRRYFDKGDEILKRIEELEKKKNNPR